MGNTVFARIVDGLSVIDSLQVGDTIQTVIVKPDVIVNHGTITGG